MFLQSYLLSGEFQKQINQLLCLSSYNVSLCLLFSSPSPSSVPDERKTFLLTYYSDECQTQGLSSYCVPLCFRFSSSPPSSVPIKDNSRFPSLFSIAELYHKCLSLEFCRDMVYSIFLTPDMDLMTPFRFH